MRWVLALLAEMNEQGPVSLTRWRTRTATALDCALLIALLQAAGEVGADEEHVVPFLNGLLRFGNDIAIAEARAALETLGSAAALAVLHARTATQVSDKTTLAESEPPESSFRPPSGMNAPDRLSAVHAIGKMFSTAHTALAIPVGASAQRLALIGKMLYTARTALFEIAPKDPDEAIRLWAQSLLDGSKES